MRHPRRDIDRLLSGTLAAERAAALRLHLSVCEECRGRYDEALLLERALAGDTGRPTRREEARTVERALRIVSAFPAAGPVSARAVPVRRVAFSLAGLAVATAAAFLVLSPVATLVEGEGVRIGGDLAVEGAPIRFWNRVEVDGGGYGLLRLDGAQVTMNPGASLRVELGGRVVDLDHSKVWCEVERGRGRFAVRTEEAVARVKGTSFAVDRAAPGATDVRVREGSVEVRGTGGEPVLLGAGTQTTVRAGEPPAPPSAYSGIEDADILLLLRRLGHAIGRGIDGAIEWLRQGPKR